MIFESVDALKGTIRPLSLDRPLIAVTEDNVKDRLLHALGHLNAIANNNDSLETISYPSGGRQVAQMGPRFFSSALLQPPPRHPRKCRVVSATVWMPPPRPASSYTNYIQKNFPAPFFKAGLACAGTSEKRDNWFFGNVFGSQSFWKRPAESAWTSEPF
jgi:hypothetical protein